MTPDRKFSLTEIISDAPCVIQHDLNFQIEKKRRNRGGANEAAALKRAELQAFELILKQLQDLNQKLDRLELRK